MEASFRRTIYKACYWVDFFSLFFLKKFTFHSSTGLGVSYWVPDSNMFTSSVDLQYILAINALTVKMTFPTLCSFSNTQLRQPVYNIYF